MNNNHDVKLKLRLAEGKEGTDEGGIAVTHTSLGPKRALEVKT